MCKLKNYKNGKPNPRIDKCMESLIEFIYQETRSLLVASCCGHGKYPMTILIRNREGTATDIVSNKTIPRKRKFYKRDKQGYYYIPETIE